MNRWMFFLGGCLLTLARSPYAVAVDRSAILPIKLTLVDDGAIAFATFQSHNQKVVGNRAGIFITYIHKSNSDYTAQQWRLAKSTDGGESFSTIYEATHGTSAPAIETDKNGTLYLGHPDFSDGNAYLMRFPSPIDPIARLPLTTELQGGAAGKYCMLLDEPRQQLYWFAHNNSFFTVGLDGEVRDKVDLLRAGPHAYLQYPHLTLDSSGRLFAAWTTSKAAGANVSVYHDVHAMKSVDGGKTWRTLDGTPIELPAVADDTGPATLVSRADEFDVHTWLSALMAKDGKLHLVYWAKTEPERQWHIRYDINTGQREIATESIFPNPQQRKPNDSGALVANRNAQGSRLYFVSTTDDRSRLACLASDNGGQTWYEYARCEQAFSDRVYSISAAREPTSTGAIVGTFTVVKGQPQTYQEDNSGRVYFFRIPSALASQDADSGVKLGTGP